MDRSKKTGKWKDTKMLQLYNDWKPNTRRIYSVAWCWTAINWYNRRISKGEEDIYWIMAEGGLWYRGGKAMRDAEVIAKKVGIWKHRRKQWFRALDRAQREWGFFHGYH